MEKTPDSVLVVEDDPGMIRLLTKWLEGAGFVVRSAENGRQAVQMIRDEPPQFLLTDWEMPYMNGLELCRWLREQPLQRYVYTVLITVRTGQDDVVRGLSAGADSFLKKPVDRDELIIRLRSGARLLELEQRLRNLARIEPLTGLFTRNTFLDLLEKEWSRSSRHHLPMSCAILDVDRGQRISEQFGRPVAEEAIRRVARTLVANSRKSDVVAHDGADSFLILLPETGAPQAAAWADRIRHIVRQLEVPVEDVTPLRITASAGIAERLHDTSSATQLLRMAEEALLLAKRSGRDRVVAHGAIGQTMLPLRSAGDPAAWIDGMAAHAVMTPLGTTFGQDETVDKAAQYFLRFRTNSVPVVDAGGKLAGIVSEKDVLGIVLQGEWWKKRIAEVMQTQVVSYPERTSLSQVYDFLCRVSIRGVVIVNDAGQPVGMINRGSLLRFFAGSLGSHCSALGRDRDDAACKSLELSSGGNHLRARIEQTAAALADETTDLQRRLVAGPEDISGCVIGSVSRIQELSRNLLAWSQAAGHATSDGDSCMAPVADPLDETVSSAVGV